MPEDASDKQDSRIRTDDEQLGQIAGGVPGPQTVSQGQPPDQQDPQDPQAGEAQAT